MTLCLACLAFAAGTAGAAPALALWITTPIGATDASQCNPMSSVAAAQNLLQKQPTLTEQDVIAWNREDARWTLQALRFSGADARQTLEDHCFVLAIDGKIITAGVVLSSYSARLIEFPIISVSKHGDTLQLQLSSGSQGRHNRHFNHADLLDAVLGPSPNLAQQLRRVHMNAAASPLRIGREWAAAVQQLITQEKIGRGSLVTDLVKYLGPPSATGGPDESKVYHWYFDTPMHVNPAFSVTAEDGVVRNFTLSRR